MDAIELLKHDHDEVKALLDDFEQTKDPEQKRRIAQKTIRELMVHEQIEEQVFYPAYKKAADEEGKALVAEGKEEHHVVDLLIDELQELDTSDEEFVAKFKVMGENVRHHIEEEEQEMFPSAKKLLKGKLDDLGRDMKELKENLGRQAKSSPRKEQH